LSVLFLLAHQSFSSYLHTRNLFVAGRWSSVITSSLLYYTSEALEAPEQLWVCYGHCVDYSGEDEVSCITGARAEINWVVDLIREQATGPDIPATLLGNHYLSIYLVRRVLDSKRLGLTIQSF